MAPKLKHDYEALTDEFLQRRGAGESSRTIQTSFESRGVNWGTFENQRRGIMKKRESASTTTQETPMSDEPVEVLPNQMDLNATETPTVTETANTPSLTDEVVSSYQVPVTAESGSHQPLPEGWAPRIQEFHDLHPEVEAALRASIRQFGVIIPVVKDQYNRFLDGHQRSRIADQEGIAYEVQIRQVSSDDDAKAIARTLNVERRHLGEVERRELAFIKRLEGASYREIAQVTGTSHVQAMTDVKRAADEKARQVEPVPATHDNVVTDLPADSVNGGEVGNDRPKAPTIPERTKGRDGKSYPGARSNGTTGKKPKAPEPERAVAPRKRVQDGLFTVLTMVGDDEAWTILAELAQLLETHAEQQSDADRQQRMEQALSPLGHLLDEHQQRMPDENEAPADVCAYCGETDTGDVLGTCETCGESVHEGCEEAHEVQSHEPS